jgi:hypothetical protein
MLYANQNYRKKKMAGPHAPCHSTRLAATTHRYSKLVTGYWPATRSEKPAAKTLTPGNVCPEPCSPIVGPATAKLAKAKMGIFDFGF